MSDVMFYGVLRMPYTMAMSDDMSRMQFYDRAQEAADRIETADKRIAELEYMVCKLAVAAPVAPAEPTDYTRTFNAIGKAVTIHPGGSLGISVKAFWNAYGAAPVAPAEPFGWYFQHGETGRTTVVDQWQLDNGWEKENSRWQKIGPVYLGKPAPVAPAEPNVVTWRQLRDEMADETVTYCDGVADDLAVDRFAVAMKAKMAASRAKGRGGWDNPEQCPVERLQGMLLDHLAKGDPVDVGNFAMMLFNRGAAVAQQERDLDAEAEAFAAWWGEPDQRSAMVQYWAQQAWLERAQIAAAPVAQQAESRIVAADTTLYTDLD